MTKADADLSLESDRLEEYLEAVTPDQPVVVIQYRSRGVPSWVFFPLILLIPLAAIVIYHRLVVERYRVQATESRRVLESWIDAPGSGRSLQGGERPLPLAAGSQLDVPVQGRSGPSVSADNPATDAPAASPAQTGAVSAPATVTTAVSSAPLPAPPPTGAAQGETNPSRGVPADRIDAHAPARDPALDATIAQPPLPAESAPTLGGKKAGPRLRSILPNPSAPEPSRDRAPASKEGEVVVAAVQPLPSKEESLRQIAEEAARKQAEILAQDETRETEIRARRHQERVKFREELREVVRLHGSQARPEIDKLARRYGYDVDDAKYQQADRIWRFGRMPLQSKVRLIRSLELPEAVILNFMSNDLHAQVRSRNGPRDEKEVRLRAARQLLSCELPEDDPALGPGAAAGRRVSPGGAQSLTAPADGAGSPPP